jgi:hypothetical protein
MCLKLDDCLASTAASISFACITLGLLERRVTKRSHDLVRGASRVCHAATESLA